MVLIFVSGFFLLLSILPPPSTTLFPYTTLFRSVRQQLTRRIHPVAGQPVVEQYLVREWNRPVHAATQEENLCAAERDRKSTRLNSSHSQISYAVFCLKKKTK